MDQTRSYQVLQDFVQISARNFGVRRETIGRLGLIDLSCQTRHCAKCVLGGFRQHPAFSSLEL
jgi:hypothetical protein